MIINLNQKKNFYFIYYFQNLKNNKMMISTKYWAIILDD